MHLKTRLVYKPSTKNVIGDNTKITKWASLLPGPEACIWTSDSEIYNFQVWNWTTKMLLGFSSSSPLLSSSALSLVAKFSQLLTESDSHLDFKLKVSNWNP